MTGFGLGLIPTRAPFGATPLALPHARRRTLAFLALCLLASIAMPLAAPAPVAAAECTGWNSTSEPPTTIRVLRTRGSSAGRVQTVNFEDYVKIVMPAELGPQHPREMLRAQAVAVKQYAWYHAMNWRGRSAAGGCYDVVDSTNDQVYSPETKRPAAAHISAVEATWTWAMKRGGRFFASGYRAGSSVPCGADAGRGIMYQNAASRCARDGKSAAEILKIYYGSAVEISGMDEATAAATTPTPTPKADTPSGLIGAGDSTGDKRGDVIVVTSPDDPTVVETRVYPSGQVPAGGGPVKIALALPPADSIGRAAADVTGDDLDDLATLLRTPDGSLRVDVARGVKGGALAPAEPWWSGSAEALGWDGVTPLLFTLGDVNGDGEADALVLVGSADPVLPSSVLWLRSDGSAFREPAAWWSGTVATEGAALLAADVDADRRADLILQTDRSKEEAGAKGIRFSVVRAVFVESDGVNTPAIPWQDLADVSPAQARITISDVNRDRHQDIVVDRPYGASGSQLVGLLAIDGGFVRRSLWQAETGFRWAASRPAGADVDGDGRGDVVIMYNLGSGGTRFFRFISNGSSLRNVGSTTDPTLPWAGSAIY